MTPSFAASLDRWITRPAPEPISRCVCCDEPTDDEQLVHLTRDEAAMAHRAVEGDFACPVCVANLRADLAGEVSL